MEKLFGLPMDGLATFLLVAVGLMLLVSQCSDFLELAVRAYGNQLGNVPLSASSKGSPLSRDTNQISGRALACINGKRR